MSCDKPGNAQLRSPEALAFWGWCVSRPAGRRYRHLHRTGRICRGVVLGCRAGTCPAATRHSVEYARAKHFHMNARCIDPEMLERLLLRKHERHRPAYVEVRCRDKFTVDQQGQVHPPYGVVVDAANIAFAKRLVIDMPG